MVVAPDGFQGWVKVDRVEIGLGNDDHGTPGSWVTVEMSGFVLECPDTGSVSLGAIEQGKSRGAQYVTIEICETPSVGFLTFEGRDCPKGCIGWLSVGEHPDIPNQVWAKLRLSLRGDALDKILLLRDGLIYMHPIFYREEGQIEPKIETWQSTTVRYIQRVYLEPDLERVSTDWWNILTRETEEQKLEARLAAELPEERSNVQERDTRFFRRFILGLIGLFALGSWGYLALVKLGLWPFQ
jgi:hypothetical protein